jgi:hypothetical protein
MRSSMAGIFVAAFEQAVRRDMRRTTVSVRVGMSMAGSLRAGGVRAIGHCGRDGSSRFPAAIIDRGYRWVT